MKTQIEQKTFKVVLSDSGKQIYKGGNIEVLNKFLGFEFKAREKEKNKVFYNKLCEVLGSGSEYLFSLKKI